jgi:hypothetical protein
MALTLSWISADLKWPGANRGRSARATLDSCLPQPISNAIAQGFNSRSQSPKSTLEAAETSTTAEVEIFSSAENSD